MLFPGHERSRHLLGDLPSNDDESKNKEPAGIERGGRYAQSSSFDLVLDEKESRWPPTTLPVAGNDQDSKDVLAQAKADSRDRWPNGIPPKGPRKYLQRIGQCCPRRLSSGCDRHATSAVDGTSSSPKTQKSSMSLLRNAEVDDFATRTKSEVNSNSSDATLGYAKAVHGTRRPISDSSLFTPGQGRRDVTIPAGNASKALASIPKESPDLALHRHEDPAVYSSLVCESSLSQASVMPVQQPQSLSLLFQTETHSRDKLSLATATPQNLINKTESSGTSPPLNVLHRDISYVINQARRPSSEAASVTSAASSAAAKSSSSSISSSLRLNICHICKKPPFKEKLKGCFSCSRHYHKGCAKPKDRITEDSWVCRRCLNKLAKSSKAAMVSSFMDTSVPRSEPIRSLEEVPMASLPPHSTPMGSMRELASVPDPQSQDAPLSEDLGAKSQLLNASGTLNLNVPTTHVLSSGDHSPTASLRHVASADLRPTPPTEDAEETPTRSDMDTAKDPSADLPEYYRGWQAQSRGQRMSRAPDRATSNLAPSSPVAAPSTSDESIRDSCNTVLSTSKNTTRRCITNSKGDSEVLHEALSHAEDKFAEHDPLASKESLAAQASPTDEGLAITLAMKYPASEDKDEAHTPKADVETWRNRMRENRASGGLSSSAALNMPPTSFFATSETQSRGKSFSARSPREDPSLRRWGPPRKDGGGDMRDNAQPVKKLCTNCQKLILGSTSMCMKCQQVEREDAASRGRGSSSHDRSGALDPPNLVANASTTKAYSSDRLNDCNCGTKGHCRNHSGKGLAARRSSTEAAIEEFHRPLQVTIPLSRHDQIALPTSPFVPETPELVTERLSNNIDIVHVDRPTSLGSQNRMPKPLIPQKRPPVRPVMADDEHCFAKKKPRMYKRVTESPAVKTPSTRPNTFPPMQKSASPGVKPALKDAAVQASSETVDRGTSPRFNSSVSAPKVNVFAKRPASPGTETDKAASQRSSNSVNRGDQHEASSFQGDLFQKSAQRPTNAKRRPKVLEEEERETACNEKGSKKAETAIARRRRQAPHHNNHIGIAPSIFKNEPYKTGKDSRIVSATAVGSINSSVQTAREWTSDDEEELVQKLKEKGVIFEEDSSSDSDVETPAPQIALLSTYPLSRPPQSSKDLFAIAPHLHPDYPVFDIEAKRREIANRPPRKQRRHNMSYLRQERGENVHQEVKRTFPIRLVKVSSGEISELQDSLAPEVEMTFSEFIGAPANPMAILTKDKDLAFRDGTRDLKGKLPRARKKFIVSNKSVSNIEH